MMVPVQNTITQVGLNVARQAQVPRDIDSWRDFAVRNRLSPSIPLYANPNDTFSWGYGPISSPRALEIWNNTPWVRSMDVPQMLRPPEPPATSYRLGVLSARYESRDEIDAIANNPGDPGGISFGTYQFASRRGVVDDFINWLDNQDAEMATTLRQARASDNGAFGANFSAAWVYLAQTEHDHFSLLQHNFTRGKYFDAPATRLLDELEFDVNSRSFALQNVLWSTAVQHGPSGAFSIFRRADLTADDRTIINQIYDDRSRVDVHFRDSCPDTRRSVYNRFINERADALYMLEREN